MPPFEPLRTWRLNRWIFAPGPAEQLAALRIGLFALLALRLGTRIDVYRDLSEQPAVLFHPLSYMRVFDHMPSESAVMACLAIGVPAALLACAGLKARLTMPVAFACALFLNGMVTAQGKVIHNDALLMLCLVPVVVSHAADAWSVDAWLARRRDRATDPEPRAARYGWPVRTAMLTVCAAYLLAGLHKLQYSGIEWATSDNLRWVLYGASDDHGGNTIGLYVADHPLLTHLFAWGTLATELGFSAVLLWPRLRWVMVPAVVGLHAGIYLTMELNYVAMAGSVVVVFTDWPAVVAWTRGPRRLSWRAWNRPPSSTTSTADSAAGR